MGETIYFLVPYNPRQVMEKVSTHCGYKAKIQGNYCFPLPPKTQATVLLYCFPLSPKTQTTTLFSNNEKKRNPLAKHSSTFAGKETPTTKAPEKISGHSRAGYNRTVVSSNLTNIWVSNEATLTPWKNATNVRQNINKPKKKLHNETHKIL